MLRLMNDNKRLFFILKYLVLIVFAIAFLYPFIWMAGTSLKTHQESMISLANFIPESGLQWGNYLEVWNRLNFVRYFFNSVLYSLLVVVGSVVFYSMMGFALAKFEFWGRKAVYYMFIALMLVPGVTITIPLYINMVKIGMNDTILGVILPIINGGGPFAVFLFTNYMRSLPHEMYESAILDGCNKFQIYYRIYFPLSLPVITTIAIINFLGSWKAILWPMIIITSKELFTLPMGIMYLDSSAFKQWHLLMAGSMLSVIPVIIIFVFLQKYYIRGLTGGAVKQ